jgi:hypothetical protein
MENIINDQTLTCGNAPSKRLDVAGWGFFLIWTGIALLANLGWGIGLLGAGIITLGGQLARKYYDFGAEVFWVMAGFFFLMGGIWELANIHLELLPFLCIAAGLVLVLSTLTGKRRDCAL